MSRLDRLRQEIRRATAPDETLWTVQAMKESRERRRWWTRSVGPSADKAYAIVCIIGGALAVVALFAFSGSSIL